MIDVNEKENSLKKKYIKTQKNNFKKNYFKKL